MKRRPTREITPPSMLPNLMTRPPNVYIQHGRYFRVLTYYDNKKRKQKWIPLSRVEDGPHALTLALAAPLPVGTMDGTGPANPIDLTQGLMRVGAFHFELVQRLSRAARAAEKAKIDFDLTLDALKVLGNKQKWKCAVTGLPFVVGKLDHWTKRPFAPSIDRSDSLKGYTIDNVRLVVTAVNYAMNEWGEGVFAEIARAYVARRDRK